MQHIKHLKLKDIIISHLAVSGNSKKRLCGIISHKNDSLHVWSLKNMMDPDQH